MPKSKIHVTWPGIESLVIKAANSLQDVEIESIMAVARGGLPIACILAHCLSVRSLTMISVSSYDDYGNRGEVTLDAYPEPEAYNKPTTIIVDDICDSGRTMSLMHRIYPKAMLYSLIVKPCGLPYVHHWTQCVDQSDWVVFPWEVCRERAEKGGSFYLRPTNGEGETAPS